MHSSSFGEIKTLGLEGDTVAADLLLRASKLAEPIMVSRGWHVKRLVEFLPRGNRLLGRNWNRGDKIEIRLRESRTSPHQYVKFDTA